MTVAVLENLALLAGAPGGIERVRQLILDLAAQGTLAGTASASTWPVIQFSDLVTSFQNGVSSRGASEGIPVTVLRLADIKNGEVSLDNTRELLLDTTTIEKYQLADGDILVIRVNGSADLVGRFIVHGDSGGALHCDHFIRIRIDRSRAMPRYVKILGDCSSTRRAIQGLFVSTAGQKTLNQGHVGSLSFLLPPLAEQHRIVAKVDELMDLCDRLEARQQDAEAAHARLVQALLDSLTQARDADEFQGCWQRVAEQLGPVLTTDESVNAVKQAVLRLAFSGRLLGRFFATMESGQTSLPAGWREVQIADIAVVGTGATPARTNPAYFDPPDIPWVTSGETSTARISATAQHVSARALAEANLTIYPPGTLIVAMYGQGKTRGQVSELTIAACTNQACAAIQLRNLSPVHRQYVKYFFEKSYDELRELAAGGAQPNLNLGKIKSALIPLPPLEEQHRIVAKVTELLSLCDQLKARIAAARAKHAQLAEALVAQAVAG